MDPEIIPGPGWADIVTAVGQRPGGIVYLLGSTDTGKSTICRYLVHECSCRSGVAYLDLDPGQSTIGPPATVGLALHENGEPLPGRSILRFVGSPSLSGHFIQEMAGAAHLLRIARTSKVSSVIIDSPGWIGDPVADEFQTRMIDLLAPDLVIAVCTGDELEPILASFPSLLVRRIRPSPHVRTRSRSGRARYREQKFRTYFAGSVSCGIELEGIGFHGRIPLTFSDLEWKGRLIALCDRSMLVVSLAIVDALDIPGGVIRFRSPSQCLDQVTSIQVGSLRLTPDLYSPALSPAAPDGNE